MGEQIRHIDIELDDINKRAEEERRRNEVAAREGQEAATAQETERYREWDKSSRVAQELGLGVRATDRLIGVSGRYDPLGWSKQRELGLR